MVRFVNLVKNEYIKTFKRVSTWVLMILVVLTAVGFNGVLKINQVMSQKSMNTIMEQTQFSASDIQQQIKYFKQEKAQGYEIDIECCNLLLEQKISSQDWRYSEIQSLFEQKKNLFLAKETGQLTVKEYDLRVNNIQTQLNTLKKNDWKAYYRLKISVIQSDLELSTEQKQTNAYFYQYMMERNLSPEKETWQSQLLRDLQTNKTSLAAMGEGKNLSDGDLQAKQKLENQILLQEYRLKNDIESAPENVNINNVVNSIDFWSALGLSSFLINVISLVIIIIAGASIANEFSSGTIKFLLINPVKRSKIFLSKYTMIVTLSVLLILGFYLINVLCAGVLFGFGAVTAPYLYVTQGVVHQFPGLAFILWKYLLGSINLIVMGTLAFAISSLLRNAAVAIGVSVFALLSGNIIMSIFGILKMDWARFLIFANVDLNAVIEGNTMFQGMTVGFSLAVIAVHMVVFFLTAWDGFMHRESI